MDKQITKLNSDELLEISGGRENYVKRSWAKKFEPVGTDDKENDSNVKSVDDAELEDEGDE